MDKIMSTGNSKAANPWRFFALAPGISCFFLDALFSSLILGVVKCLKKHIGSPDTRKKA